MKVSPRTLLFIIQFSVLSFHFFVCAKGYERAGAETRPYAVLLTKGENYAVIVRVTY
jgi:hypothetical protein